MPFVFKNQPILDGIKNFRKGNFLLEKAGPGCLLDYYNGEFKFPVGSDCETATPVEQIGSGITKRAIREMRKRFDHMHGGDDEIFCIDYGSEILKAILTADTKGIRFYFGLRSREDGKDFISLILVGIDSDENEMIMEDIAENQEAGKEVGHGRKYAELKAEKDPNKFKLANF